MSGFTRLGVDKLCGGPSGVVQYDALQYISFDECYSKAKEVGRYFAYGNGNDGKCQPNKITCKCWRYKDTYCDVGDITGSDLFKIDGEFCNCICNFLQNIIN